MPDAAPPSENYGRNVPWWRRPLSMAIALLINILLLIMLLEMTPTISGNGKSGQGTLTTFNVNDQDKNASSQKKQQQKQQTTKVTASKAVAPRPIIEIPKAQQSHLPSDFIELSQEDFKSADVSKLPSHTEVASNGGGNSSGIQGDSASAPGSGPHGEPLYAAEWYRRPTDAELGPYLAKTHAEEGNYGDIACQTVARFHVDNCVIIGDSPPGTHIALQMQDAAFQFLVRPPRVGGKTMVGAWVRIRITISNVLHERR